MRFSSSSLVVAAVAALLLAACASHGVVPVTNSFGPSVASPEAFSPDATPTQRPCAKTQAPWNFGGACGGVFIKAAGGSASMVAYDGFTIKAKFPTANPAPSAGEVLVVRDATNTKKDITGLVGGKPFPAFNKIGSSGAFITVKPLLYLKAFNQGGAFSFTATPLATVTSVKAFPGSNCVLTKMNPTNNTWQTEPVVRGKITGHTVVFSSEKTVIQVPKNGTIYLAMGCFNT